MCGSSTRWSPDVLREAMKRFGDPFWSPDSTSVAFPTARGIVKVRLSSGAPQPAATWAQPQPIRGGAWSSSDIMLVAWRTRREGGTLVAMPSDGGEPTILRVPQLEGAFYYYPDFLPNSNDFLFLVDREDGSEREVYLATLRDSEVVNPTLLLKNETAARFTPAHGGRVLFVRDDNLYAQPLNTQTRRLEGDPELVVAGVASQPGGSFYAADFSVAHNGTIAWRAGTAALAQITMFDRQGTITGVTGPPSDVSAIILSPDDTQLLVRSANARLGDGRWTTRTSSASERRVLVRMVCRWNEGCRPVAHDAVDGAWRGRDGPVRARLERSRRRRLPRL